MSEKCHFFREIPWNHSPIRAELALRLRNGSRFNQTLDRSGFLRRSSQLPQYDHAIDQDTDEAEATWSEE
jgi:hypothetical protein